MPIETTQSPRLSGDQILSDETDFIVTTPDGVRRLGTLDFVQSLPNIDSSSIRKSWAELLAEVTATPPADGTGYQVIDDDTGTHTDPVVGGTVDNAGIYIYRATGTVGLERISDTLAKTTATSASRAANAVPFDTWTGGLADALGMIEGDRATVSAADTGTHTSVTGDFGEDGGQTPNAGVYEYSDSESDWVRVDDLDSKRAGNEADRAEAAADTFSLAFGDRVPEGMLLALLDSLGFSAGGVLLDGGFEIEMLNGKNVDQWIADTVNAIKLTTRIPYGTLGGVMHNDGLSSLCFLPDGTVEIPSLSVLNFFNGVPVASIMSGGSGDGSAPDAYFPSEIDHVPVTGQSLSLGADAQPAISTTTRFDGAIRFAGGVRSQDTVDPYASFVPLIETESGSAGETPISGAIEMMFERIAIDLGEEYQDMSYQILGSAPGVGGTSIAQLSYGTTAFNRYLDDCQAAYDLSQDAGKSYSQSAFLWVQGENDETIGTTTSAYSTSLVTMRNDLEAGVHAITGPVVPLKCISYQTQAQSGSDGPQIAIAQYEVARDNEHHHIACPLYFSNDSLHLTALNSKILGAYLGLCKLRVCHIQPDWKPLVPIKTYIQGKIVIARFNVPFGKLQWDVVNIPLQTNYGFSLVTPAGVEITITSVEIINRDHVKFVTATPVPVGSKLRGGWNGKTNLADQQGDVLIFDGGGINYPMHNRCLRFQETITIGV